MNPIAVTVWLSACLVTGTFAVEAGGLAGLGVAALAYVLGLVAGLVLPYI